VLGGPALDLLTHGGPGRAGARCKLGHGQTRTMPVRHCGLYLLEVPGNGLDPELGLEEGEEGVRLLAVDFHLAEEREPGLQHSVMRMPCSNLVSCLPLLHTWYFSVTNRFISELEPGSCPRLNQ
jgi:hypothetical protein